MLVLSVADADVTLERLKTPGLPHSQRVALLRELGASVKPPRHRGGYLGDLLDVSAWRCSAS